MSNVPVEGLSARQEQAIVVLLSEPTIAKAAETVGVNTRTLYRWLQDPDFSRQYRRARRESFGQAMSLAQRYAPMAIGSLAKIMVDPSAPHASRVSAAAVLLKFGRESIELDDLELRIQLIEVAEGLIAPGVKDAWQQHDSGLGPAEPDDGTNDVGSASNGRENAPETPA